MSVVVIDDLTALEKYVPAWEDLAAAAIELNVFYGAPEQPEQGPATHSSASPCNDLATPAA
jgi:hypothetical protein